MNFVHKKLFVLIYRSPLKSFNPRLFKEFHIKKPIRRFNPLNKRNHYLNSDENGPRIATRICLTVLGNGSFGQPRCLALFTDFKGYLFNCGEGVGRLCREYEINIPQIRHIFVTQKVWKNMSGLPDVYLTHKAYGVHRIALHGPPGTELFTSVISAIDLNVAYSNRSYSNSSYTDSNLEVEYVQIQTSDHNSFKARNRDVSYSYICDIFGKQGDFNAEKCVEFGVPLGPELLKLKNGEDLKLPNGQIVHSSDVHDEPHPRTVFLVVDCPSSEFLDSFVGEKKFEKYQLPFDAAFDVYAIFHFSPPEIIKTEKYQDWITRFHQNTQHFIMNSDNSTASSEAILKSQSILHLLHPKIFGLLKEKENVSNSYINAPFSVTHAPPMLQLHIRPERKLYWSNVLNFENEEFIQTVKSLPGVQDELRDLHCALKEKSFIGSNAVYPEVVFLGTGSSTSSAFRNVSAILININVKNSVLLDCGEGTLMQLVRYYGVVEANSVLKNISCIFVSHKHTDHYLGLFEIIKARADAFKKSNDQYQPLALVLPRPIHNIFKKFCDIFENHSPLVRIFSPHYLKHKTGRLKCLEKFLGDVQLETVSVQHCAEAFGAILYSGSEWKIAYSGDTAPCHNLINAGKNCTLLIHEASIEDGLINEATSKNHSTPSQVMDISEMMNAKYTIMTHFSKRYLAVPVIKECNNRHIAMSFDFMKVQLADLPILPLFLPVLKCLFQEQLESHSVRTNYITSFESVVLKTLKS